MRPGVQECRRFGRAAALSAALLFGLAPGLAPAPGPAGAGEGGTAGKLLVAADSMADPHFRETVIYMVEHDARGAMGLIVNRPVGTVSTAELLERMGEESQGVEGTIEVHYGGPVERGLGFFLHSADMLVDGSRLVGRDMALSVDPEMLRALARGQGPAHSLFVLGYAGWGPHQLESELARHDWFVIPAEPALVFATDPDKVWKRALALRSIDL